MSPGDDEAGETVEGRIGVEDETGRPPPVRVASQACALCHGITHGREEERGGGRRSARDEGGRKAHGGG